MMKGHKFYFKAKKNPYIFIMQGLKQKYHDLFVDCFLHNYEIDSK